MVIGENILSNQPAFAKASAWHYTSHAGGASRLAQSTGGAGEGQRIHESLTIKPWTGDPTLLLRVATAMRIRDLESNNEPQPLLSVAEATRLAVEHNLVSRYTNYLVVLEHEGAEKPMDLPDVVMIKHMAPPVLADEYLDILVFCRRQEAPNPSVAEKSMSFPRTVIQRFSSNRLKSNFALALNKRMCERNTGAVPSRA